MNEAHPLQQVLCKVCLGPGRADEGTGGCEHQAKRSGETHTQERVSAGNGEQVKDGPCFGKSHLAAACENKGKKNALKTMAIGRKW